MEVNAHLFRRATPREYLLMSEDERREEHRRALMRIEMLKQWYWAMEGSHE